MTRKEALREAMQIVSSARIGKQRKADILSGLALCQQELPFTHWSPAAVFDACDTWVREHGALPLRAFTSPAMPSHTVLKHRFGMTAREFRDRYYPMDGTPSGGPYSQHGADEWDRRFVEEFHRLRCTGQADYNKRRGPGLPTWNTVAAMNGVKCWTELLRLLGLSTYGKPQTKARVRVVWDEPEP